MSRHLHAAADAVQGIGRRLAEFRSRAGADAVYLLDDTGVLIAHHGRQATGDQHEVAALMACDVLVTMELAKYLGDKEISVLIHEGARTNCYLRRTGVRGVLAVQFEDPGALGRVRALAQRLAADLAPHVDALECDRPPPGSLPDGLGGALERRLWEILWSPAVTAIERPGGTSKIIG